MTSAAAVGGRGVAGQRQRVPPRWADESYGLEDTAKMVTGEEFARESGWGTQVDGRSAIFRSASDTSGWCTVGMVVLRCRPTPCLRDTMMSAFLRGFDTHIVTLCLALPTPRSVVSLRMRPDSATRSRTTAPAVAVRRRPAVGSVYSAVNGVYYRYGGGEVGTSPVDSVPWPLNIGPIFRLPARPTPPTDSCRSDSIISTELVLSRYGRHEREP